MANRLNGEKKLIRHNSPEAFETLLVYSLRSVFEVVEVGENG